MDRFFSVQQRSPIIFKDPSGFKRQVKVISIVKYKDYRVAVDMPAKEKVSQANDAMLPPTPDIQLQYAENGAGSF
jgi:hypothetical protein